MPPPSTLLFVALLILALAAAAFFLGRKLGQAAERAATAGDTSRVATERARFEAIAQRVPLLERELLAARSIVVDREARLNEAQVRLAEIQTRLFETEKAAAEKLELMARAESSMKDAFQALSMDALDKSRAAFLDQAQATFGQFRESALKDFAAKETTFAQLVSPIRESLSKFEVHVHDIEQKRTEAYSGLSEQFTSFRESQTLLRGETEKLVTALRAPSVRGRWGEFQLRRVVEMAGMVQHCDFVEQSTIHGEDGRLRPDLIVHLPGGKTVVVDAKVPLSAYLDAKDAKDEGARRELISLHAKHLRKHVSELSDKSYADHLSSSPDFVVMYVPIESAFADAVQADPSLLDDAVEGNVIPAGPMTLLSLLKGAAYGWRQERIAESAEQISELGKELYNRISVMAGHLGQVGDALGKATMAYNRSVGSLESRVLVQARRFKDLGAAVGEDIPEIETVSHVPRQLAIPGLEPEDEEPAPH
ncbi:MAG: DNA recombination protein RmuC [Vicinamibacteria bacterium]|nr:DNA recombination protein RmuC [Vicinamibacteria bacterium]MBP9944781.1 DNA recombination protein RmuC [Vicinamibacteria bacterium]